MINQILRWMKGYVQFDATVADLPSCMDDIKQNQLHLWSVYGGEVTLSGQIKAADYKSFAKIIRRHGGNVHIVKRKGFPFFRFRHRKRWGAIFGILFFGVFLGYTQLFLWEINIAPGEAGSQEKIADLLQMQEVTTGTLLRNLDEKLLQQQLLIETTDFSWIALNFSGTTLYVDYAERVQIPTMSPDTPCDIVARKAGQIRYVEALHGTETVSEKEIVLPGDLLISGMLSGTSDPVHAEGRVLAETVDIQRRSFSLSNQINSPTGNEGYKMTLSFFGVSFPIWDSYPKLSFEKEEDTYALSLFGHTLPISATIEHRVETTPLKETYTEQQAKEWMVQSLQDYEETELADVEILSYRDEMETVEGICYLTRYYHCEEDIAQKLAYQ